jgi:hypothetical protein
MQKAAARPNAKASESPSRAARTDSPAGSPALLEAPGAAMPKVQPPADLVALQRIIQKRPASPPASPPDGPDGQRLLAHELSHTAQQPGAAVLAPPAAPPPPAGAPPAPAPLTPAPPALAAAPPAADAAPVKEPAAPEESPALKLARANIGAVSAPILEALGSKRFLAALGLLDALSQDERRVLEEDAAFLPGVRGYTGGGRGFWVIRLRLRFGKNRPAAVSELDQAVRDHDVVQITELLRTHPELRSEAGVPGVRDLLEAEFRGTPEHDAVLRAAAEVQAARKETDKVDLGNAASKLEQAEVGRSHDAEIRQIIRHLQGKTYDSDVDSVCYILSHWDSTTITASWAVIGKEWLDDLVDNVSEQHFQRHARVLAATYKALPLDERWAMVLKLTDEGVFSSVSDFDATRVLYLVQGFPPDKVTDFVAVDDGKRYRRFTKKLPAAEKAALERSVSPEQEQKLREQELARRGTARQEEQALKGTVDTKAEADKKAAEAERQVAKERGQRSDDAIARISKLLWTGASDWAVTDREARDVFGILKGIAGGKGSAGDAAMLGGIVRYMDGKGLFGTWIDNMPEKDLYERDSGNVAAFIKILAHRPPEAALQHAIKLLSYRLFDWAVTDEEAILAYHLIRALPPSAQHAFKMRDNAKWFVRMERNLEKDVLTGKKGYVGEDPTTGKVLKPGDAGYEGYGLVDEDGDAGKKAAAERAKDTQTVQDNERPLFILAAQIHNCSADNAATELTRLTSHEPDKVRAFVRHLDRLDEIEPFLNKLSPEERWSAENSAKTLTVLRYRDPAHNIAMLIDLVSYGLFDWEVNRHEARLAYEIIKVLPAKTRDDFIAQDPQWFRRIDDNISLELRKSGQFGFYEGGEGDRPKLLGKLLDPAIWEATNIGHLEVVLRMIRQVGLTVEAAPLVQAHWPRKDDAKLLALVTSLGYPQTGKPAPETIVDETDTNTAGTIYHGLGVQVDSEKLLSGLLSYGFLGRGEVRGVKLDKVQDALGGHVAGIEFGKSTDTEREKDKQDTGEVDFEIDEQRGLIHFKGSDLPIQSVNLLDGKTTLRAGAGKVGGAEITVKWATTVDPKTFLAVNLDTLVISNLLMVSRDRIFGIGKIDLSGFKIWGQRPTGDAAPVKTKSGLVADIGRVFERILLILAGLVEALPIVGDAAPLNPLFDPGGEAGLGEQIAAAFSKHFNLKIELGGLTVSDVTDSQGGHIKEVKLGKTKLEITMSQSAKLRQEVEGLKEKAASQKRELTEAEKKQIAALEARAAAWEKKESDKEELERRRESPSGLTDKEKSQLDELVAEIDAAAVSGSVEGGLTLTGVDFAGVKADELALTGVTLGGSAAGLPGVASDFTTKKGQLGSLASITTADKPKLIDRLGSPGLKVRAAEITGKNVSYTSSVRRDKALEEIIAKLEKKLAETVDARKITEEELTQLEAAKRERDSIRPLVQDYEKLTKDFAAIAADPAKLRQFRELESFLSQPPSIKIANLKLKNAELGGSFAIKDGGVAGKRALFSAEEATLTGVEAGGIKVETVTGQGLSLGVGDGTATFDGTQVKLAGIEREARFQTLQARQSVLEGLAKTRPLSPEESAELDSIAGRVVEKEGEPPRRVGGLLQQYAAIQADIAELAAKVAAEPKGTPDWKSRNALERRKAELKTWTTTTRVDEVTVDEAHVKVSGLGDVFAKDYSLPKGGLKIGSSQEDKPIAGKVTAKGVFVDDKKIIDKAELEGLDGEITIIDEDTVQLTKVKLARLALSSLHVESPGMKLDVDENAEMKGLEVTAKLTWGVEETKEKGVLTGARHRKLQDVYVKELKIASIEGKGIHVSIPGTAEADLDKGTIKTIVVKEFRRSKEGTTFEGIDVASTSFEGLKKATVAGIEASAAKLSTGALHFDTLEKGKIKVSIADLDGDDIKADKPGLGITIKKLRGGGVKNLTYDVATGDIEFPEVKVGELELSRVVWASGPRSLNVRKRLFAKGITLSGYLKYPPKPKDEELKDGEKKDEKKKKKKKDEAKVFIRHLNIKRAEVEGTDYGDQSAGRDIRITSGYLEDIRLTNFDLDTGKMGLHLGETNLNLGESQIKKGLSATGNLQLESLDFDVLGTDHTRVKVVGLSTYDLLLKLKDDKNVNVVNTLNLGGTKGVSGVIETIGPKTFFRGMDLGFVRVSELNWTSGSKKITSEGAVELTHVTLDAVLDQGKEQGKDGLGVEISKLHVDKVVATHLKYVNGGVTVEINKKQQAGDDLSIVNLDLTDFAWSTAGGISGGKLKADSANTGALSAELGSALEKKLKIGARAHAAGLEVEFEKGGRIIAEAKKLSGSFAVRDDDDKKLVGGSFADLATGKVTYDKDSITIPGLKIGNVTLNHLDLKSPQYNVTTKEGGSLAFGGLTAEDGITADVTIDLSSADQTKVSIHSFHVPKTTVKAIKLELLGKGITLDFPATPEGTLTNIKVKGLELSLPGKAGGKLGLTGGTDTIHIQNIDFKKLGAVIGSTFNGKADFSASDLQIDLVSIDKHTIKIPDLRLDNVDGALSGTPLKVARGLVKGIEIATDGGKTSVKSGRIEVGGIDLNSPLVHFLIEEAVLPEGFKLPANPDEPIVVDELKITKARFDLWDIPGLTAGKKEPGSGSLKDLKFLDTITGDVTATIHFEGRYPYYGGIKDAAAVAKDVAIGMIAPAASLLLPPSEAEDRKADHDVVCEVRDGKVNLVKLEGSLSALEDAAVDFKVVGDRLVVSLGVGMLRTDLLWWGLSEEDKKLIETKDGPDNTSTDRLKQVHVSTLAAPPRFPEKTPEKIAENEKNEKRIAELREKGKTKEGLTGDERKELRKLLNEDVQIHVLEISKIAADLSMKGPSEIDLGTTGKIKLGGPGVDGVSSLKASGALSMTGKSDGLALSIEAINASLDQLNISGTTISTIDDVQRGTKGGIKVRNVHDVHVVFNHLMPQSAWGEVQEAVATNIRITLPKSEDPAPKKKP